MVYIAQVFVGLVALIHLYILWLEMFAWTTRARRVFRGFSKEYFEQTKVMAANQGLYNGFLSAGLLWSFFIQDPVWSQNVAVFFLVCVAVAGLYGGVTASKKIFYVQTFPAVIGIALLLIY